MEGRWARGTAVCNKEWRKMQVGLTMACETMEGGWFSVSEGYVISDMTAGNCNELHAVTILSGTAVNMVRLTGTKAITETRAKKRKG